MEVILLAATGVSVGTTLATSQTQASAVKARGEFESGQFKTQARISDLQAKSAITRGREVETEEKIKTKKLIGAQRARLSAQGLEIESGTALDIQLETAELGAADALTIKNNAFREATGHRIQAVDYRNRAELAKIGAATQSRNTLLTGGLSAVSEVTRSFAKLTT
ncbi:hypothetical protein KAR91_87410 [Candidatus Pacearchaeota archaeon]|nr:hypothetical protein [Candidatus Pacearchaeota archaeon]